MVFPAPNSVNSPVVLATCVRVDEQGTRDGSNDFLEGCVQVDEPPIAVVTESVESLACGSPENCRFYLLSVRPRTRHWHSNQVPFLQTILVVDWDPTRCGHHLF